MANLTTRGKRTNLVAASRQWASRPADQRFWTLLEFYERMKLYAEETCTSEAALSDCRVVALAGDDMGLAGPNGGVAKFQNYSFGQLCGMAKSPAAYLQELPAEIAASALNHRLQDQTKEQCLLLHKNGGLELRCITSSNYSRIWNWEVAQLALALEESEGWKVPPARPCGLEGVPIRKATDADCLKFASHKSLGINPGDDISPSGIYGSDRDSFIFQVNEDHPIDPGDGGQPLYRGVFWSNSEVGDARWRGTFFLFDSVCGNHIVWDAKVLAEVDLVHRGNAHEMFSQLMASATDMANRPASEDEDRIRRAKQHLIAPTEEKAVEVIFRKGWPISKQEVQNSFRLADMYADDHGAEPLSAWGFASGLTRLSQGAYADKRTQLDRVAGRVMAMAF